MNLKRKNPLFLTILFLVIGAHAQSTEFTYQGSLRDGANLATGTYDFEFALFDGGGTQLGGVLVRNGVTVANGIFGVSLDFGNQFSGPGRLLEIRVRAPGGSMTTLSPRQLINSAPYAVKALSTDNAVTAGTLTGAIAGDVTGTQVSTTVARLQGRNLANTPPTNGQVLKFNGSLNQWVPDTDLTGGTGGGTITGVTAGTGLTGGGTSGTVSVGISPGGVNTTELAANAVTTVKLADGSVTNVKIADVAGSKITGSITTATILGTNVTGPVANATNSSTAVNFSGPLAGDVTGTQNATVLANNAVTTAKISDSAVTAAKIAAGQVVKSINGLTDNVTLTAGSNISITPSGNTLTIASTGGGGNSILNQSATAQPADFRINGTGTAGTFNATNQFNLGGARLIFSLGSNNLFAGINAGATNPSGVDNTYFGNSAGSSSTTGDANSFFGVSAGFNNRGMANSFFGRSAGFQNTTGFSNSFFGVQAGRDNSSGSQNSFFGNGAGRSNNGSDNSFFGVNAGTENGTGVQNSFFGSFAGDTNTSGSENSFYGYLSGAANNSGSQNSFFGNWSGRYSRAVGNSFFGYFAGRDNVSGTYNSIFGFSAGISTNGSGNSFYGNQAGYNNTSGSDNTFVGATAGVQNIGGANNAALGAFSGPNSANLQYATAIGSSAVVTASNRIQLGRTTLDTVAIGLFDPVPSSIHVCLNGANNTFTSCSSSARYKENIVDFNAGLDVIKRLRPVSFAWKESHEPDIGLIAEEVEKVEPSLSFYNKDGKIEGVKYEQLTIVLINAIKEQQTQIANQQKQLAAFRSLICKGRSKIKACRKR